MSSAVAVGPAVGLTRNDGDAPPADNRPVDYDLARLGSREFEHMAQALVLSLLGARVEVFGDGPDGGREATYNGLVR